jgi:hypothetical protein
MTALIQTQGEEVMGSRLTPLAQTSCTAPRHTLSPLQMNIKPSHLEALEALGYTEAEARFLYLVATHSGSCCIDH